MTYTPRHENQHDESYPVKLPLSYRPYTYDDCWDRCIIWLVDGGTQGRVIPGPIDVRRAVGKFSGNPAIDGAGSPQDVERGVRAFGVKFDLAVMDTATARRVIETRRPGLQWYAPTDFRIWPGKHRCDPNFRGRHAVGGFAGKTAAGKVKVMDPVCHGYYWVAVDALLRSMELYSKDHGLAAGTVYLGRLGDIPKAAPAPLEGRVYALPSTGANLRHLPRATSNLLAVVPSGGRLQVAGPSGAGAPAAGTRSRVWLEVTGLGSLSLQPSAWVLATEVSASPPSISEATATPPLNGTATSNA